MKLARVIGTVVATTKYEGLEGVKLLVVQPLDRDGNDRGAPAVAADATAQAGPGHLVFVVGSREAAQAMPETLRAGGPGDHRHRGRRGPVGRRPGRDGRVARRRNGRLMYIGRVVGSVVATVKIDHLEGRRLLLVDQLGPGAEPTGDYDIAVDVAQAGPGDTVLVLDEGNGARQILGLDPGAIRAVIVGVVDEVTIGAWGPAAQCSLQLERHLTPQG